MKPKSIKSPNRESDFVYNEFAGTFEIFIDQNNIPFVVEKRSRRVVRTGKSELCSVIRNMHFPNGGTLSGRSLNDAYETIKAQIKTCHDQRIVIRRIFSDDANLFYVLGDRIVHITANRVAILKRKEVDLYVEQDSGFVPQVPPELSCLPDRLPELLGGFFDLNREEEWLLITYIISCFLPNVKHPVLYLHGEAGSAKSTMLRMIKRLVDPDKKDLFAMPQKEDDLFALLSNNYFVPLDNIGRINQRFSDLLCQAVTDGTVSKRKLYSDNTETTINLHSIVAISGIEMSITRSDLLDRALTIQLKRISESRRRTEREIWSQFDRMMPEILGAIFNTISRALAIVNDVRLEHQFRMADFAQWGYCIAESIREGGGRKFLSAYRENIKRSTQNLIATDPLIYSVELLMESCGFWKSTPKALLVKLQEIYLENSVDGNLPYGFPTTPILLSKKMALISSDLNTLNLEVTFGRGNQRFIKIERRSN